MNTETSPLLGQQKAPSAWTSVYLLSFAFFILAGTYAIIGVPLTQLIEDNICRQYVGQGSIELGERNCKNDQIQTELAFITGLLPSVESIVGLIVGFPYGVMGDKIGRKPILYLAIIGNILFTISKLAVLAFPGTLPISLIIATPLLLAIGGGPTVHIATLYTMTSDLVDSSERASAFFFLELGCLLGISTGPVLASKLMESYSPWIPAILSIILVPIVLIPLFLVPETLPSLKQEPFKPNTHEEEPEEPQHHVTSYLKQSLHLFKESLASLQSRSISIIIATCLIREPEFIGTSQFFGQYVSKRFNWTLAETGYLRTLRGITQMLVLLAILPALSKLLLRWQTPAARDLTLARGSVIIATIGVLWMAAPQIGVTITGLEIQSLGGGLGPLSRSLANSFVSAEDISKLNTLMGIVETAGSLFAGPALAWLFEIGMKKGGLFIGLPYFGLAAAFSLCVLGLFFVHAPVEEDHDGDDRLSIEDDVRC